MKTTHLHDWLVTRAGAERVLESLWEMYPGPIHTLFHSPEGMKGSVLAQAEVRTSFLQNIPGSLRYYRNLLPLYPLAVEQFDLSEFDLVISNSHAAAKGVLTRPDQLHISYCLTPFRYAWDLYQQYMQDAGLVSGPKSWVAKAGLHYIRLWDLQAAQRVDHFVTLSRYVARRIEKLYRRRAEVIYPPVDVDRFMPAAHRGDYFVTVSRLVPYKKVPLMAEVFRTLGLKLVILGDGPERAKVRQYCGGKVEHLGAQSDAEIARIVAGARAFVFAAEEDFGIAPVEAQAAGVPVIALGKGGTAETVLDGRTGVLYPEQTRESLARGVHEFLKKEDGFDPEAIRRHALKFSRERFAGEFREFVDRKWNAFKERDDKAGLEPASIR